MRPTLFVSAFVIGTVAVGACDSSDDGESEVEATLTIDPRFVDSLETGPFRFDASGDATVGESTKGVLSIYVSRSNAEGCIGIDAAGAQDEGPFISFDSTADIYRFEVDAASFEIEVNGTCLGACTADAAAEFALLESEDGLVPSEPLTEAKFFNIECEAL